VARLEIGWPCAAEMTVIAEAKAEMAFAGLGFEGVAEYAEELTEANLARLLMVLDG
jgi:hypothetical protein